MELSQPSLGTQLTVRALRHPAAPAITCGGTTITYEELESRANRLARAYQEIGVERGDTVTIGLSNSVEFLVSAFACWKLGAAPQPVSYLLPPRERLSIIALATPRLIVGVAEVIDGYPAIPAGYQPDASLSDAPHPNVIAPSWKIMTSGGSTGTPKLIVSGTDSVMDPHCGDVLQIMDGGVVHVPGPLYHNTPFVASVVSILLGNHLIMTERFDARSTLDAIRTHRVDIVSLVPTMMQRILRLIKDSSYQPDLVSVRAVWHMGGPCPRWLKRAWIELLGPYRLWEIYGGTEYVSITRIRGDEWLAHPGSVGRPYFGEIGVRTPEGAPAQPGEVGEIYMRPTANVGLFRYIGAETKTIDNWITTGDLGHLDDEGYLYVSDRRLDMIVSGGVNIFPAEVETAILEHPLVLSVVVVGLPHHDLSKIAHAVVQVSEPLDADALAAHLAERLVRYKHPRSYNFVDYDLRDDAGKVRRSQISDAEIERLRLEAAS